MQFDPEAKVAGKPNVIDPTFLGHISANKIRWDPYRSNLGDKLYCFNQMDKLDHDILKAEREIYYSIEPSL